MRRAQRAANLRRLVQASPRVQVSIDELVLHEFAASERHAIGDAVSHELERMFRETDFQRSFRRGMELTALDAGRITIAAHVAPGVIGAQVARAVYSSLRSRGEEKKE